jgi:hypothetical protein
MGAKLVRLVIVATPTAAVRANFKLAFKVDFEKIERRDE